MSSEYVQLTTELATQAEKLAKAVLEVNEALDIDRYYAGITDLAIAVKKGIRDAPYVSAAKEPVPAPGPLEAIQTGQIVRLRCFTCNGLGNVRDETAAPGGLAYLCPSCSGKGVRDVNLCPSCSGEGYLQNPHDAGDDTTYSACLYCAGKGFVRL